VQLPRRNERAEPVCDRRPGHFIPRSLQDPLPIWVGVAGTPAAQNAPGGLPMTLGHPYFHGLPQPMVEESIARFAQKIAPALRDGRGLHPVLEPADDYECPATS
jgi:hypothetical protein